MKLLIVTQVVDRSHPILGFFQGWIEEFAKHAESVEVIALEVGDYDLPRNVQVHSLHKETDPTSAIGYSWRLLKKAYALRNEYDVVFVHMIPEYVLAGSPVWTLWRKPVSLWYTHGSVSLSLRLASFFVKHIFTAAKEGMNLRSKKVVVTGHGIDLDAFKNVPPERDLDLLTVGRITPSKNLEELIEVLALVREERPETTLTIIGVTGGEADEQYLALLKALIEQKGLGQSVTFMGAVPHADIPSWLSRAKVFVHAAKNGSLDKVLLEALAAKTPVVTSAPGAKAIPLGSWQVEDDQGFAHEIVSILNAIDETNGIDVLHDHVSGIHGLKELIENITGKLVDSTV